MARAPVTGGGRPTTSPSFPTTCRDRARADARGDRGRAHPFREGGGAAGVVPRVRRLHLRPERRAGNGTDDLVRFLTEDNGGRTGYCEQFASAMAVMARSARHPGPGGDRVPGARAGRRPPGCTARGTCTPGPSCSSRVPAGCASSPPRRAGPAAYRTTRPTTSHSSAAPAARAARSRAELLPSPAPERDAADGPRRDRRLRRTSPVPVAAGRRRCGRRLLVAASAAPPADGPRAGAPAARIGGGPEEAWAELRDTALDLRLPWPRPVTAGDPGPARRLPRRSARPSSPPNARGTAPDVDPEAVQALDRIVLAVERLRYARTDAPVTPTG